MSELIDRGDVLGVVSCYFEDSFIEDADVHCAELEREINRLPAAPRWHRVEDELPSMDGYDWVLGVVTGEAGYLRFHKAIMMVSFDPEYKEWFIDEYPDAKITVSHWMELPESPKEITNE